MGSGPWISIVFHSLKLEKLESLDQNEKNPINVSIYWLEINQVKITEKNSLKMILANQANSAER